MQLRDVSIDLETGVVGETIGPEVRAQLLFHDSYWCRAIRPPSLHEQDHV